MFAMSSILSRLVPGISRQFRQFHARGYAQKSTSMKTAQVLSQEAHLESVHGQLKQTSEFCGAKFDSALTANFIGHFSDLIHKEAYDYKKTTLENDSVYLRCYTDLMFIKDGMQLIKRAKEFMKTTMTRQGNGVFWDTKIENDTHSYMLEELLDRIPKQMFYALDFDCNWGLSKLGISRAANCSPNSWSDDHITNMKTFLRFATEGMPMPEIIKSKENFFHGLHLHKITRIVNNFRSRTTKLYFPWEPAQQNKEFMKKLLTEAGCQIQNSEDELEVIDSQLKASIWKEIHVTVPWQEKDSQGFGVTFQVKLESWPETMPQSMADFMVRCQPLRDLTSPKFLPMYYWSFGPSHPMYMGTEKPVSHAFEWKDGHPVRMVPN